jgi:hypothetical protein
VAQTFKRTLLRWLASLIGTLIGVLGVIGVVVPDALLRVLSVALTQEGLYVAAVFRVAAGLILIGAASAARMPWTLRILGIVSLVAGGFTPFFGVERAHEMVNWFISSGPLLVRAWAVLALILGLFIMYAVTPGDRR